MNPIPASLRKHQGFTLIEVLIAVVVLSIGLLGVAGLQLTAMRSSYGSYGRSQAVQLAGELADRMRANIDGVNLGQYLVAPPTFPSGGPDCTAGDCTPAQLALYDRTQWATRLRQVLPGAFVRVACVDSLLTDGQACSAGSIHTITIMWDDQRTGAGGFACSNNTAVDLTCFAMSLAL